MKGEKNTLTYKTNYKISPEYFLYQIEINI